MVVDLMAREPEAVGPLPYPAEYAFEALTAHAIRGRLPGDCRCDVCGEIVADICRVMNLTPATARTVRAEAARQGWGR